MYLLYFSFILLSFAVSSLRKPCETTMPHRSPKSLFNLTRFHGGAHFRQHVVEDTPLVACNQGVSDLP